MYVSSLVCVNTFELYNSTVTLRGGITACVMTRRVCVITIILIVVSHMQHLERNLLPSATCPETHQILLVLTFLPVLAQTWFSSLPSHCMRTWEIHSTWYVQPQLTSYMYSCWLLVTYVIDFLLFSQNNPVRTIQTNQSRVTIDSLGPCLSYWVVVTSVTCTSQISSSP